MKNFDVHIVATASDYYAIEAESEAEAKEIMRQMIEEHTEKIKQTLAISITDWTEAEDIKITDVVEY